ncbi:hypothetical protein GALL_324730 [mine drainage metagenome]|uniref:Uncharacterized protein n=1 Tax=mine drainage metagenome TaxID=410659 RepID=A0A1J5QQN4_9ZZZZ
MVSARVVVGRVEARCMLIGPGGVARAGRTSDEVRRRRRRHVDSTAESAEQTGADLGRHGCGDDGLDGLPSRDVLPERRCGAAARRKARAGRGRDVGLPALDGAGELRGEPRLHERRQHDLALVALAQLGLRHRRERRLLDRGAVADAALRKAERRRPVGQCRQVDRLDHGWDVFDHGRRQPGGGSVLDRRCGRCRAVVRDG